MRAIAFVLLALVSNQALAEWKVSDYQDVKGEDYFLLYVSGLGDGYLFSNAYLEATRKEKPMYCQTRKLSLSGSNYLRILDDELIAGNYKSDTPH